MSKQSSNDKDKKKLKENIPKKKKTKKKLTKVYEDCFKNIVNKDNF